MATVDFPAPERPVKKTVKPRFARRRIGLLECRLDLREGHPVRDAPPLADPFANVEAGKEERLGARRHLGDRAVFVLEGQIDHLREGHDGDPQFLAEAFGQGRRGVGGVKRAPVAIVAGAAVVMADDEVAAAEILGQNQVQQRVARPGEAHRQRQQAEQKGLGRVVMADGAQTANAGVVVEVARLGHPDHRQDQQVGLGALHGLQGHLEARAMNRVARLIAHHPLPAEFAVHRTDLGRGQALLFEVEMQRRADDFEAAADIVVRAVFQQTLDPRVGRSWVP